MSLHAIATQIPGQLGQQLAAQPFLAASTGVLPTEGKANLGGSSGKVMGLLATADATQKELTAQAQAGIDAQASWIKSLDTGDGAMEDASKQYSSFMGTVTASGKIMAGYQTQIANAQTNVAAKSYANNLRLVNRSISDALGLAGKAGGSGNLGAVERQQTMLGFGLQQKQINFQVAMAGFQAPGLTSEERAARQEQAKIEADYAQRQLNLSKQSFGIQAGRGVTDTQASKSVMTAEWEAQKVVAAASKAIAAEQVKQGVALAKANAVVQRAESNFAGIIGTAEHYVSVFSGTIGAATTIIRNTLNMPAVNPITGKPIHENHASGIVGNTTGKTSMTVGEAGTETVAVLKNPRAAMLGSMMGGGMQQNSGPATVNLYLTVQGDVKDEATVAKIVRAVEDSFNRKAARLGMRTYVSAAG
jgi:hypothetical protein